MDRYSFKKLQHAQVPLRAQAVDEPAPGRPSVDMLRALPENDRLFYMDEENVVDKSGAKCSQIDDELQERYGFLG